MTGGTLLDYGPATLAWAALAYRSPAFARRYREPGLRYFWFGLLALALGLTALLPPVYLALDQWAGISNVARPVAHGLVMVAAWCVQTFLLYLDARDARVRHSTRRDGFLLLAMLALLGVFFSQSQAEQESIDFANLYADNTAMVGYRLVLLAYLGLVMVNALRLPWRYAGVSRSRPSLHLGLRLVALGAAFGLAYIAYGVAYLIARRLGVDYLLGNGEEVPGSLLAVCITFFLVGSTMPAWGPRLGIPAVHRWVVRYRALRRLYPLWRDLCRAHPGVALVAPSSPLIDAVDVRGLGFRLYRRVVEIRDARLALRPYFDPRVESCVAALSQEANLSGRSGEAVLEAVRLAAALRAKALGRKASDPTATSGTVGGADLDSEAEFLSQVAGHYSHSRIVREAVSDLEGDDVDSATTAERIPPVVSTETDRLAARSGPSAVDARRRRLARLVTEVLAPVPTVSLLLLAIAWHSAATTADAVKWAVVSVLFASLLPFLHLLRRVRQRRLTDIHVRRREQRPEVLLVGIISVAIGLVILALAGAPRELVALVAAMVAGLSICTFITLFWKVSFHTAVSAGAEVILVLVFGWPLLALAPLVGLLGWARVELRDHTPVQVIAGATIGAAVAAGVFLLLR